MILADASHQALAASVPLRHALCRSVRSEHFVTPPNEEVTMTADPRALAELLEESQDLQADAMRPTHDAIDELVELSHSSIPTMTRRPTWLSTRSTRIRTASEPRWSHAARGRRRCRPRRSAWLRRPRSPAARRTYRSCRPPPPLRTWRSPPTRRHSPFLTSAVRRPTRWSPSSAR
jgi:hypothetical protein